MSLQRVVSPTQGPLGAGVVRRRETDLCRPALPAHLELVLSVEPHANRGSARTLRVVRNASHWRRSYPAHAGHCTRPYRGGLVSFRAFAARSSIHLVAGRLDPSHPMVRGLYCGRHRGRAEATAPRSRGLGPLDHLPLGNWEGPVGTEPRVTVL